MTNDKQREWVNCRFCNIPCESKHQRDIHMQIGHRPQLKTYSYYEVQALLKEREREVAEDMVKAHELLDEVIEETKMMESLSKKQQLTGDEAMKRLRNLLIDKGKYIWFKNKKD